jgi:hypothetical protein
MIGRRSLADRQSHKRICSSRRKQGGSSRRKRAGGTCLQDSDWSSGGCFEASEDYKGCLLKPILLSRTAYGPIHPAYDKLPSRKTQRLRKCCAVLRLWREEERECGDQVDGVSLSHTRMLYSAPFASTSNVKCRARRSRYCYPCQLVKTLDRQTR